MEHMLKILFFDIESTGLRANFGHTICVAWKEYGKKKVHLVSLLNAPMKGEIFNDKNVVKVAAEALSSADVIVSWYGLKFDVPFLNSRLIYHGLPPIDTNVVHLDLWRTSRYKLKLSNNRLNTVQDFLQLDDAKSPLKHATWLRAQQGNKKAIRYIIHHCKQDVKVLEQAYEKLKPLIVNHPNVNLVTGVLNACPKCGVTGMMKKEGHRYTMVTKKQRYSCKACGGWSLGKPETTRGVQYR